MSVDVSDLNYNTELYLVGMGTSVSPVNNRAGERRTNATMGLSRKSSSPTSTLEASAPVGIFFIKCVSTYEEETSVNDGDFTLFCKILQGHQGKP